MTDDLERRLAGLDGPRPLPAEVRARLESTVLAALTGATSAPAPATPAGEPMPVHEPDGLPTASPLDSPRPLPSPLRARLEEAVMAAVAGAGPLTPAGEVPTLAPAAVLRPSPRRRRSVRYAQALAAAAVLAFVLGVVATLGGRIGPGQRDDGRQVAAGGPSTATTGTLDEGTGPDSGATATTGAFDSGRPAPNPASTPGTSRPGPPGAKVTDAPGEAGASSQPGPNPPSPVSARPETQSGPPASAEKENHPPARSTGPGAGTEETSEDPGPAPPYARPGGSQSDEAPAATAYPAPSAPRGQSPSEGSTRPPLRIAVLGGDPAQEAGFRAYVGLLNKAGGVRRRAIELVSAGPGKPTGGVLATVNLSPRPIAGPGGPPGWAQGPLLETLTASEYLLTGRVFGFASPPERQGHLVADAVFPKWAPGASAVIYRAADGPLGDAVPKAIARVLADRGVRVAIEPYDPDKPARLQPADAAFLSLEPQAARSFLRQAKDADYAPGRGLAGVYSLFEPSLLSDLPEGTRVVSPYVLPPGDESEAIGNTAKGTGVGVLHGWATAKSLAVALWRSGAQTPDQVTAALEALTGYDSGLAPPYEFRPGTHSRTPEGATHEVRSGGFRSTGGFRRDPY